MNADQLKAFAHTAADQRARLFGVRVRIGVQELTVPEIPPDPEINLETGGFREKSSIRLRMPISFPPPALKTPVHMIAENRTYYVSKPAHISGAPHAAEYTLEAELP